MGQEIERKFLLVDEQWRSQAVGVSYRQGYLPTAKGLTVRVRIAGEKAYLTIKGPTQGYTRAEFEYPMPVADAEHLLDNFCDRPLIEKTRYTLTYEGVIWVIDEFWGDNQGLILAEVELSSETDSFALPPWLGEEVTSDPRYYNSNLAKFPYRSWQS